MEEFVEATRMHTDKSYDTQQPMAIELVPLVAEPEPVTHQILDEELPIPDALLLSGAYSIVKLEKNRLRQQLKARAWSLQQRRAALQRAIAQGLYPQTQLLLQNCSQEEFYQLQRELHLSALQARHFAIGALIENFQQSPSFNRQSLYEESLDPLVAQQVQTLRQQYISDATTPESVVQACLMHVASYQDARLYIEQMMIHGTNAKKTRNISIAVLDAACPSFTLAGLVSANIFMLSFSWFVPLLTLACFAVIIWPVVSYIMYQRLNQEYNALAQEKLYRIWVSARLSYLYQQQKALNQAWLELSGQEDGDETVAQQKQMLLDKQGHLHNEIQTLLEDTTVATGNDSLKLKCHMLSLENFHAIKERFIFDRSIPSEWASQVDHRSNRKASLFRFLCALGTLSTAVLSIGLCIGPSVGWAFLGAGIAAFLATPFGAYITATAIIVLLAIVIGYAIYKTGYEQANIDAGIRNKAFMEEHRKSKASLRALLKEREIATRLQSASPEIVRECEVRSHSVPKFGTAYRLSRSLSDSGLLTNFVPQKALDGMTYLPSPSVASLSY